MAIGTSLFDLPAGDYSVPFETEGSPAISVDEITSAKIITRSFVVKRANYVPVLQTPGQLVQDYQFPTAYLVSESPTAERGSFLWFQRIYAQVPLARTEPRLIPFTRPGVAAAQISTISGKAIGWNQYGASAPNTRQVQASVAYTYALNATFTVPNLTRIVIGPNVTANPPVFPALSQMPVDFCGPIYTYTGNVQVGYLGNLISEPRWTQTATTNPPTCPAPWIQEVNVTRWRGPIWQMEVVSVTNP